MTQSILISEQMVGKYCVLSLRLENKETLINYERGVLTGLTARLFLLQPSCYNYDGILRSSETENPTQVCH